MWEIQSVKRHHRLFAFAVLSIASGSPPTANAQSTIPERSITLSVSGGISLGSWQAGATWATLKLLRRKQADTVATSDGKQGFGKLTVVSGASAGNINALIAATEWCTSIANQNPESSLFWQVWIPIGWESLTSSDTNRQGRGILSKAAFKTAWDNVSQRIDRYNGASINSSGNCRIPIALTTTKVVSTTEPVGKGDLRASVQRTVGVVQLVKEKAGDSLLFREPTDVLVKEPSLGRARMIAPRGILDDKPWSNSGLTPVNTDALFSLLLASSAFPFAFGPERLRLYPNECFQQACASEIAAYADGGLFDNQAISAALALERVIAARTTPGQRTQKMLSTIADMNVCFTSLDAAIAENLKAKAEMLRTLDAAREGLRNLPVDSAQEVQALRSDSLRALNERIRKNMEEIERGQPARCRDKTDSLSAAMGPVPKVLALFIDAGIYRGPLGEWNRRAEIQGAEPKTPIRSTFALLSNAIGPATQYELAILGRALTTTSDTLLSASTRALPLLADGFAHFGAFLAAGFRQHDFYVGVYDGIRHIVAETECQNAQPVQTCVDERVDRLLASDDLNLNCSGKIVLARLYSLESRRPQTEEREGRHIGGVCRQSAGDSSRKVEILRGQAIAALASAVFEFEDAKDRSSKACSGKLRSFVDAPFCESGLESILTGWKERLKALHVTVSDACIAGQRNEVADLTGDSAEHLCHLLARPYDSYRRDVGYLMKRTQIAERGAIGLLVDLVSYADRANVISLSGGLRIGNPAVNQYEASKFSKFFNGVMPYTVDLVPRRELEFGIQPLAYTFRLRSKNALSFESRGLWRMPFPNRKFLTEHRFVGGPGIRMGRVGPWVQYVSAFAMWGEGVPKEVPVTDALVGLLGGSFRLGMRWEAHRSGMLFVGFGDVANLLRAATRGIIGDRR